MTLVFMHTFFTSCFCFALWIYTGRYRYYKEEVIDKCGEPEPIESHIKRGRVSNVAGQSQYYGNGTILYTEIEVVGEEWIYDFGRRKFKQYMRFENGRLTQIKDLGYAH